MSEILSENELQMMEDNHRYSDTGPSRNIRSLIASHRALQAERDTLLEWKKIILGTGTEQEAVVRMAATEYTQTAIESWKLANEKLAKERDALKAEIDTLTKERDAWKSKSWTDLVQFLADAKDNLFQQYCNLQLLYGEQKHALRRLQAERDALKAELELHKEAALNFIDLSAELHTERDALKAELVAIENQQGLAEERRQFNVTIDALKAELAERKDRFHALALEPRGLDPERACEKCRGFGVMMYGSTATWRGGHGGQALTQDVCCHCWGSGDAKRPWKSWRS